MKTNKIKPELWPDDELYARAYALYQQGQYKEASQFLRVLTTKAPLVPRYWVALGHSLKMENKLGLALEAYKSSLLLPGQELNPSLMLQIADCLRIQDKKLSLEILQMSCKKAKGQEKVELETIYKTWENS
jgi:predicted Zn-dependent protease